MLPTSGLPLRGYRWGGGPPRGRAAAHAEGHKREGSPRHWAPSLPAPPWGEAAGPRPHSLPDRPPKLPLRPPPGSGPAAGAGRGDTLLPRGREVRWGGGSSWPRSRGSLRGWGPAESPWEWGCGQGWSARQRGSQGVGGRAVVVGVRQACGRAVRQGGSRAGVRGRAGGWPESLSFALVFNRPFRTGLLSSVPGPRAAGAFHQNQGCRKKRTEEKHVMWTG